MPVVIHPFPVLFGKISKSQVKVGVPLKYERTHREHKDAQVFVPTRKPQPPRKDFGDILVGVMDAFLRIRRSDDYLQVTGSWYTLDGKRVTRKDSFRMDFWSDANDDFSPMGEGWKPKTLMGWLQENFGKTYSFRLPF